MLSQDTQTIDYSKPNIEKLNKEKRQHRIFFFNLLGFNIQQIFIIQQKFKVINNYGGL